MRKITQNAINAFIANDSFNGNNTIVNIVNDGTNQKTELYLFNNLIAYKINNNIYISSQGYETSTTRDRLNALVQKHGCGRVYIKDFSMWYETSGKTITTLLSDTSFTQIR